MDLCTSNTPGGMEFPGEAPHDDSKDELGYVSTRPVSLMMQDIPIPEPPFLIQL
jgi:hypothetical protein